MPLGVEVGDGAGEAGDGAGHLKAGGGDANNGGLPGFGLGTLSMRPPVVKSGDRLGTAGLGGVAGVAGGRVEGGGGGMTKGDRGEKLLLVRDRNDGGGKDGTKKGGSIDDGRRPKPRLGSGDSENPCPGSPPANPLLGGVGKVGVMV